MMNDFHKGMLGEIIQDWTVEQIDAYIVQLEQRVTDLRDWISHLKTIRKKKIRKPVYETGARDGR